jgi:hypothetical protein
MADLSNLIEAVLQAITEAQDNANLFTRKLAGKYQADKILHHFPVPNGLLTELDLDLNFAIDGDIIVDHEKIPFPLQPTANLFTGPARDISRLVILKVREALKEKYPGSMTETETEKYGKITDSLKSERVESEIVQKITRQLCDNCRDILNKQGTFDRQKAADIIKENLETNLIGDPDLAGLLHTCGIDGNQLLNSILQTNQSKKSGTSPVGKYIDELEEAYLSFDRELSHSRIKLITDAKHLAHIPVEKLNKLRIKAELREFKWVVTGEDEEKLYPNL